MIKVRRKVIREKTTIAIYQFLLIGTTDEEIMTYLESDKDLKKNKEEIEESFRWIKSIIDHSTFYMETIAKYLKSSWTIDRLSKMEQAILLVGTYEMLALKNDKKIVINEAIEMAKKYCDDQSYKYINGVLNQIV